MNCPGCGLSLELKRIEEFPDFALVIRTCTTCRIEWGLRYEGNTLVSIRQGEVEMEEGYGFDYTCPHCSFTSYVATVFQPKTGWKCLDCGKLVPNENIIPRGSFQLLDYRAPVGTLRGGTRKVSTYQRASRASKPIPEGAVALATIAQDLKIEPKKLRSWLRKVGWRASEEAKSAWIFSPSEAEEVKSHFGR